jgi:hypothetical protein
MARVNVGVNPKYLSDQHLIAESVEITMIVGSLKKDKWYIKGKVPTTFCLGTGHINFFKPKILYLKDRLDEVNIEMVNRGFNPTTRINLLEFYCPQGNIFGKAYWEPTFQDTSLVRSRIIDRLKNPLKAQSGFHKYYGKPIDDMDNFCQDLKNSKLFYV